jgi:RNA polymerase sigma-70 factor (ECF subfamily)
LVRLPSRRKPSGLEGDAAIRTGPQKLPQAGATPKPAGLDDLDCVRRARKGDHDAFRVLVERYQGRAFRQAVRILRSEDAARDAVQEAFVKAYTSLDRFEERSSFFTWLYRLVTNQCIDMKRREHADRRVEWREGDVLEEGVLPFAPEVEEAAPALPIDEVARKELRDRMATAIGQLPETTRETLLLREVDGLAYAEIAEVQGIPRGTVMSRLHYARRKLSELLRGAGVAVEDAT